MKLLLLLHFGNAAVCILLALHLVLSRDGLLSATRMLALNYALFATQSLLLIAHLQYPELLPNLLRPLLALLLGPALLQYFRRVIGRPLQAWELLHALPCIVFLSLAVTEPRLLHFLDFAILGSFSVYLLWGLACLRRGHAGLAVGASQALPAFRWLSILVALMAINLFLEIGITVELESGTALENSNILLAGALCFLLINAATALAMLQRSPYLQWMFESADKLLAKYQKPTLEEPEAQILFQRWEKLMNEEALYKVEFGIGLAQAARKLGVPARDLSFAINSIAQEGYSQYLNRRRVDEALKLLNTKTDATVMDIMLEAGFSSKSHFNKEFARITGMSPSAYKKKIS